MSFDDIYARMLAETINGVPLNSIVGSGDPKGVGEESLGAVERQVPIKPGMRILEIGSGCGRVAVPLAKKMGADVQYVGIDIIPGLVSFCRREISSRLPNFEFYAVHEDNPAYDRFIAQTDEDLSLKQPERLAESFDLAIAFSVFTHLQRREAEAMLRMIWSRLKDGGMAVLSFLLIDDASRAQIRKNQAAFFHGFKDLTAPVLHDSADTANGVVGFDLNEAVRTVMAAGFEGIYAVQYGHWRSMAGGTFQDILVLKKDPLPSDFDPTEYLDVNPDVKAAGMNPFLHYRNWGKGDGRKWKRS